MTDSGPRRDPGGVALFALGFRPFFTGAAVYAVLSVGAWTLVYTAGASLPVAGISLSEWHAHEMIYGYSAAVIAGFLLTAVRNWTGIDTVNGWPLLALFGLWTAARVCMLFGTELVHAAAVFDMLFAVGLAAAFAHPVFRVRKWKQLVMLTILVLLAAGNAAFYLGCLGDVHQGARWGIYAGLYLVVGLILIMGRRVIPLFIQGGVGYPVTVFNSKWIDRLVPIVFVMLLAADVFASGRRAEPYLATALFALNLVRLAGWHTPGIWRKPLLWSLYLAYAFVVLGFLLLALSGFGSVSRFLAIHSLTYGGIGLMTLSMMMRVSLGHTGRNVHHPPGAAFWCPLLLVVGAVFRVLLPLADMHHYIAWIAVSQAAWILAFAWLAVFLIPILVRPRIDGRPG
ncbi:MAG: NnrS family protein [Arenicellales bacterium]